MGVPDRLLSVNAIYVSNFRHLYFNFSPCLDKLVRRWRSVTSLVHSGSQKATWGILSMDVLAKDLFLSNVLYFCILGKDVRWVVYSFSIDYQKC